MRLLDQIALGQAAHGGEAARRIHEAPLRYIVDEPASRQCFDMVRAGGGLLHPSNPLLRLPAELFWLEWLCEPPPGQQANHRLGALVDGSPDGRSGIIQPFWQQDERQAVMASVKIVFDLDRPMPPPPGSTTVRRLRHAGLPGLDPLFGHMLAEVDPVRADVSRPAGEEAATVRRHAEAVWFNLPFVLAFAVLLGSRDAVEQRPADLVRLNRARVRRGRAPLLDHVQVHLRLGGAVSGGGAQPAGLIRGTPRLHFVRGHSVRRGTTVFWRVPHLRGDATRPIRAKTVTVSG